MLHTHTSLPLLIREQGLFSHETHAAELTLLHTPALLGVVLTRPHRAHACWDHVLCMYVYCTAYGGAV
jgi:hypothetical protein